MPKSTKDLIIKEYGGGIKKSFDPELLRAFDVADKTVPEKLRKPENVRLYPDKLRLSGDGVFYTLQGEGKTMGMPTVFVRLHICNLRCVWCDAYYTWNPKSKEFWTESYLMTPKELAKEITKVWEKNTERKQMRVVFTGGEPLLQQKNIFETMTYLPGSTKYEIETNGTIMPIDDLLFDGNTQFNCSPKLSNSKNIDIARIKKDVLIALNEKADVQFKFVVMTEKDIKEIEKDFIKPFNLNPDYIVLMPQGVTSKEVWDNAKVVAEYAKKKGYRLMGRLHTDIWGARRKV